jgi:adenine-specific DNA-methyltransferase
LRGWFRAGTGSIFVQISDENLGYVSGVLNEVFGANNLVAIIPFRKKTMPLGSKLLEQVADFLLWYAKDREQVRYHKLYQWQSIEGDNHWNYVELPDGTRRKMTEQEVNSHALLEKGARVYQLIGLYPAGFNPSGVFDVKFKGKTYRPLPGKSYGTTEAGMQRLIAARRVEPYQDGDTLRYVLFHDDYPISPVTALWSDSSAPSDKTYVVQTSTEVVKRCILMSTNPGDLVLDPTCGAGTTAFVAEQWGRRWITCDTSRVALSLARQRLLTARFPYYRLRSEHVKDGFKYTTAPHIRQGDITNNEKLDLCKSLEERERVIRESAQHEILYDRPEEDKGKVRVSGPFTVEAIPVASLEDSGGAPIAQFELAAGEDDIMRPSRSGVGLDAGGDYTIYMIDLLKRSGGVHFKNGRSLPLTTLRSVRTPYEWLHAESETGIDGDPRRVAISFGSRHGPVTPKQVLEAIQQTRDYEIVLFVGFACDPEAGRMIEMGASRRELHFVHAAPDILVGDLVKTSKTTKLFTVFGLPDVKVKKEPSGEVKVTLTGLDIYDPVTGETTHDDGENVAAWFLDHNYDGRTFCVCQAFFPGGRAKNPWEKLQKALKGSIDAEKFEALRGTTSIPFKPGNRIAVKVIDDRGNEVIKVVGA